jgi:hypothetical protein
VTERIFVFGSNQAGRHGRGAALHAVAHKGAIPGCGEGLQGQSYAIPTKDRQLEPLPLDIIKRSVKKFLMFAQDHRKMEFEVTAIGCGLAGYAPKDIAPMFNGHPTNVFLPKEFNEIIWGFNKS